MTTQSQTEISEDIFLFDAEKLHTVTDEKALKLGLNWFRENRVTELQREANFIAAYVEDETSEEMLFCKLDYNNEGVLRAGCECNDGVQPCGHAVAILYHYAAENTGQSSLLGAVENAIDVRAKRGRTEVDVHFLGDKSWFGNWKARSIASDNPFSRSYRVNIRALNQRSNYCSCPDFSTNQLGTCKHIEAALHQIKKRSDYQRIKDQSNPHAYVYLNWNVDNAPQVCLHKGSQLNKDSDSDLNRILDIYFNASGYFQLRLPEDFFRLAELVQDRADIDLGEDAIRHVRRLATDAAHQVRAKEIREQIESSNGHLPGVQAKLYPYQVEGVAFLAANGRALLADDMGLGKTLQSIAAASWLMRHAGAERVLIVCPASLKQQ